jgi:hypothetical protein
MNEQPVMTEIIERVCRGTATVQDRLILAAMGADPLAIQQHFADVWAAMEEYEPLSMN